MDEERIDNQEWAKPIFLMPIVGISQGTVVSWITRNRRVESLPVVFIYDFSRMF